MGFSPNAEAARWRRGFSLPGYLIRRIIGRSTGTGELQALTLPEKATNPAWPRPQDTLAVIRDADYIRWRYFGKETGKDVYRFRLAGAEDRLVVIRLTRSGYRGHIRVLDVLDLWPQADARSSHRWFRI